MSEIKYNEIIKRIVDLNQEKLNDWELEFIASVYEWHVLKNGKLSDRQKEIIIKINGKIMGRTQ